MTEFHASLVAIGAVVVIGVISYNKWQEWRAKKSVEQAFSPMEDDVLMSDGEPIPRQEPVLTPFDGPDLVHDAHPRAPHGPLDSSDDLPSVSVDAAMDKADHILRDAGDTDADVSTARVAPARAAGDAPRKRSPLDPLVDLIVPLALEAPVRGEKVTQVFHTLHLVGNKPVRVVGETASGDWEPVAVGGIYRALQVGVQMATRNGSLSELEFSELASRLDQMADDLAASPQLPEMSDVIAAARALHQRVQDFDAKLSINVRANSSPWMIATLKPALQRQGMELRPDGKLVMPDGDGGQLFSVSVSADPASETTPQITLLLPVALVAPDREGFRAMTAFAKTIAGRLAGTVVDDVGQPLPESTLEAIGREVDAFYREMEQVGIPAGSPLAHRLFA